MANQHQQEATIAVKRTGIRRWLPMADSLFDEPAYRNYFLAFFFYFGAMQMMILARPWIAYELGDRSEFILALTVATNFVPSLVLSPYAGAIADRFSKRTILQVCALVMAGFAALTSFGLIAGWLTWWHVALIGVAQGSVMTFITPTRRAIVPDLVRPGYILNATALHTVELNINRTVMIAIAGFIIDRAGAEYAYMVIVGMYLISALALFAVPVLKDAAEARKRASRKGSTMEGIRYAAKDSRIRSLLLIGVMGAIFGQPIQSMVVLFEDVLDVGADKIGLLLTAMGAGALVGSMAAASLGDFKRKGLLLIGFFTLLGAAIIAFSVSTVYLLSLALMVIVGFGHSGRTSVHLATLQAYSPTEMRGRIMALNAMQSGLQPLSVVVIGGVAELWNAQIAFGVSGAIILAYGLWELLFSKSVRNLE